MVPMGMLAWLARRAGVAAAGRRFAASAAETMRARPFNELYRTSRYCPFGITDTGKQGIQISLSAIARVLAMRNVNTPTCNVSVHAKKVTGPTLFGRTVINEHLCADHMDIAMFDHRISGNQ